MFAQLWFLIVVAWTLTQLIVADWIDDITGWGSDAFSAVYDWVRGFVRDALRSFHRVVNAALHAATDWLLSIVYWVLDTAMNAVNGVWSGLAWWVQTLWSAVQSARDFAQWLNDGISAVVNWSVGVLWGAIRDVANAAYRQLVDLAGWVVEHVFTPLAERIADLIDYIGTTFTHWVQDLVSNLWCFVKDVAGSIGGIAQTVVGDVLGPFMTVLDVALHALKWLVYFATHPFDWFTKLFDDAFSHGSRWFVAKAAQSVQENMDTVDHWLARFFE